MASKQSRWNPPTRFSQCEHSILCAVRRICQQYESGNKQQKRPKPYDLDLKLGYKDSNLEMTQLFINI